MKNTMVKVIAMWAFIFIYANGFAQEQPNPTNPKQPTKAAQQSPKDEFTKKLNDFQPKLNDLLVQAKENATSNPNLSKEVFKLNDMVGAFKGKLDKYDITPREQQSDFASSLNSDWDAIQAQYNKSVNVSKKNPNEENNQPPKQ